MLEASRLLNIYDFSRASDYAAAVFALIQKNNPQYSMRAWCLRLGVIDAGTMSRILAGQRRMPHKLVVKLAVMLELGPNERAYFELIAHGPHIFSPATLQILGNACKKI